MSDKETEPSFESQDHVEPVVTTRRETRSYYNKIARMYDTLAARSEGAMCDAGLEMLAVSQGEHVLDIGCGTGRNLLHLVHATTKSGLTVGIDLAEQMLDQSRTLLQQEGFADAAVLCQGDGAHLPFASASFDAVFASFTLELFDTPEIPVVLGECRRVLRPQGRIGVVSISREGDHHLVTGLYEWMHRRFPKLLDCRPIYVQRALEDAGFAIQDARQESMWLPVELVVASNPGG